MHLVIKNSSQRKKEERQRERKRERERKKRESKKEIETMRLKSIETHHFPKKWLTANN